MIFEVSDDVRRQAGKCLHDQRCLEIGPEQVCAVEGTATDGVLFVVPREGRWGSCPYQYPFGRGCSCTCPVRHELHKRYGF